MSALPGLTIGPLDPDATAEWGTFAAQSNARGLIRQHAQMYSPGLTRALSLKRDDERTKGLDLEEVESYVQGLTLENGDPVLPDGAAVTGATVRGERGRPQTLCFTYSVESGRHGKWYAPYDAENLPESAAAGDEFVRVHEMRERGVVAWDEQGADTYIKQRENSRLARENAALRKQLDARDGEVEEVDLGPAGDTRTDNQIAEENQQLRRANVEMGDRLAALEAAVATQQQQALTPDRQGEGENDLKSSSTAEEPPFEGYDDLKAAELAERLKKDDTSDDERRAVLVYERAHSGRATVVRAAEESLGRTG